MTYWAGLTFAKLERDNEYGKIPQLYFHHIVNKYAMQKFLYKIFKLIGFYLCLVSFYFFWFFIGGGGRKGKGVARRGHQKDMLVSINGSVKMFVVCWCSSLPKPY